MTRPLRIGTRGSPLALAQAREVERLLRAAHPDLAGDDALAVEVIRTTGDRVTDRPLSEVGGKGVFTKELDEALFDGRIDLAVHSMKDVPTWLPDGIVLACMLERADVRDVFISSRADGFDGLPAGSVVGTTSLRRQAQVLARWPALSVTVFRGNVQTRLRKLEAGEADATLLALAGLERLGMTGVATRVLEPDEMLPAVGQGAIGVACRTGDDGMRGLLAAIDHATTTVCVSAERAMLDVLDGSCRTPIAGLCRHEGETDVHLRGLLAWPDGSGMFTAERRGPAADAEALGRDAGHELRAAAGEDFFARLA